MSAPQPGDSRLRSLRSLLLPHPRRCLPGRLRVRGWCTSASGLCRLRRLPVLAAATRRAPDIPNLAYRLLRFRREAFSAPVCDVLPERRRQKVSCHHRRRSNRRRSRGTNWRRIVGIEFGQADRGNVTGHAVNHQPSAALPHPTRRRSSLAGQAIVHPKCPADNEHALGNVMSVPTVNSLARLSTYKVRTFESRHLLSFSPTHHLMAVHFPKLTACALVAPERRIQQGIEEDPERCMRTRTWTWWKPRRTREVSTRSQVTSQITPDAGIP